MARDFRFAIGIVAICGSAAAAQAAPVSVLDQGYAKVDQTASTLGADIGFNGATTVNYTWVNGRTFNWSYGYDGTTLTFTVDGRSVSKAATLSQTPNSISGFVNATSRQGSDNNAWSMYFDITSVNNQPYTFTDITATYGNSVSFGPSAAALGNTFLISGLARASWTGPLNGSPNSRLAFAITPQYDASLVKIAEPGSLLLLVGGLIGVGLARRCTA